MSLTHSISHDFRPQRASYYQDQIYALTNLPTLPQIATEIMHVARENTLSINQIVPLIDRDPSLAMKLLSVANSAYYGLPEKVDSLRQAIVVIGLRELTNLTLSISVIRSLSTNDEKGAKHWKSFWEFSAACGHYAEILNGELKLQLDTIPYSLGLLHDIGKVVLYKLDPERYAQAEKIRKERKCLSPEAEMEVYGITHMDAGKWVAEKWKLSESLKYAIGYHHNPKLVKDEGSLGAVALINVVDWLSYFLKINNEFYPEIQYTNQIEGWNILKSVYDRLWNENLQEILKKNYDYFEAVKDMVRHFDWH